MTPNRPAVFASCAAVALCVASGVAAEPVALEKLPVGEIGAVPDDAPDQIPAPEVVDGIHPALPPRDQGGFGGIEGSQFVTLFSSAEEAATHHEGGMGALFRSAMNQIEDAVGGYEPGPPCFQVAQDWRGGTGPQRWPPSFEQRPTVHGAVKGSPAAKQYAHLGVRAVRLESLELAGAQASLSVVEAWLDPGTLGARTVGRSSLALARVARGPGHLDVYAAKDPTGTKVHFVVTLPRRKGRAAANVGRHAQVFRGDTRGHSDCGHARLSLEGKPGLGEQATLTVEVVVAEPPPLPTSPDGPPPFGERPIREMRVRNLAVHLGVSRSATDRAIVPTVSFGWVGDERRQEIY